MGSGRKLILVAGVLAGGICAALPFQRRSHPPPDNSDRPRQAELALRGLDVTPSTRSSVGPPVAIAIEDKAFENQVIEGKEAPRRAMPTVDQAPAIRRGPRLDRLDPPPEIAADYQAPDAFDSPPAGDSRDEARPVEPSVAASSASDPIVRHRIIDGDDLRKLARRYLGDGERQGEIFAANRDLLTDPEVLPIGIEIVIPQAARP